MRVVRSRSLGMALLAALSGAVVGFSETEPVIEEEEKKRVAGLIKKLGHDEFREREAATKELAAAGERALPLLRQAAATSDDPEVRMRAQQIVRTILWGSRKSKSVGLEMVPMSTGEFKMGSPVPEGNRKADEVQHPVRITRAFLIGVHEVTQEEYQKVMETNPSWFAKNGGGRARVDGLDTARFPVETVTWFDAIEFCNQLSKLDGYEPYYKMTDVKRDKDAITSATVTVIGGNGYRLPTEAEWEYACRAGTATPFNFGWGNTGREANLKPDPGAGGYGGPPSWKALNRTTTVGSYKAAGWNLRDMHGNAGEWCWDWYDKDYYAKSPVENPTGPETGTHRVVRGGSWMVPEGSGRSASRFWLAPGERKDFVGFRVARTP